MNLMIHLTDEQYKFVLALSKTVDVDATDLIYRALELGWPALERETGVRTPPPPPELSIARHRAEIYGPRNPKKIFLVK